MHKHVKKNFKLPNQLYFPANNLAQLVGTPEECAVELQYWKTTANGWVCNLFK